MGDDVSGDDTDDQLEDDDEAEPLDTSGDFDATSVAPSAIAAAAAAAPPVAVSPTFSPSRDRRTSSGTASCGSSRRRTSGASFASGSSQDSPAIALECEDDIEGDETDYDDQSEVEALSDGEDEEVAPPALQEKRGVAAQDSWKFVGISRRSLFDTRTQTRWAI
jgi:hypothetical protein